MALTTTSDAHYTVQVDSSAIEISIQDQLGLHESSGVHELFQPYQQTLSIVFCRFLLIAHSINQYIFKAALA